MATPATTEVMTGASNTRLKRYRAALTQRLFEPVDAASLVAYRIAFGLILMWEVSRYFNRGWIRSYYIDPELNFSYFGFSWIKPWPGNWMYVHFVVVAVAAFGVTIGCLYRISAVVLFLTFSYWFLLDEAIYLNHLYLVVLLCFLAIVLPVNRTMSVDARLRPSRRSDVAPTWALWLVRGQIGLVYFYGGIAKLNHDWLHTQPMRMWLESRASRTLFDGLIPIGAFLNWEPTVLVFVYGGLLFDLTIPFLLLWKRTRLLAICAAVAFHLTNAWMFTIGIFPWFMILATLIFFAPNWPRRVFNWPRREDVQSSATRRESRRHRHLVLSGLGLWFAVQCLMPFRHVLYSSNVHWTEEGHRFSWHMKLRSKTGRAVFLVEDEATGFRRTVPLNEHLTPRQRRKMATHPDMILQFAHYIEDVYREQYGLTDPVVRANVKAALNGREFQDLIDSSVDLTQQRRTLWKADWIVPFEESPLPEPGKRRPDDQSD